MAADVVKHHIRGHENQLKEAKRKREELFGNNSRGENKIDQMTIGSISDKLTNVNDVRLRCATQLNTKKGRISSQSY